MNSTELADEDRLAAALRGQPWSGALPGDGSAEAASLAAAAIYHGVAGLLFERPSVSSSWPEAVLKPIADQARAQAMWELRHREVLSALLAAFCQQGVRSVLMKGTAIAYDLYVQPSARARGDTDILVAAGDVPKAQALLEDQGFVAGALGGVDAEFALQQPWKLTLPDGGRHAIDLHWQVMNAPSLRGLLTNEECGAGARPLPRLSPDARAMDRVRLLLHTCLHRAVHCNTPYFVEQAAYYGSGRLIWAYDVHLLANAFDGEQWSHLCALATGKGVAAVCLDGLAAARSSLGTEVPCGVLADLEKAAVSDRKNSYLVRSTALSRAWQDVRALPGFRRKLRYARARILPSASFVRDKYPQMANSSLSRAYARRLVALFGGDYRGRAR
jgi:hypothetical protein